MDLEARRTWMRAGCPVPDEKPPGLCDLFFLAVDPGAGLIAGRCSTCGETAREGGLRHVAGGMAGIDTALGRLEKWMVQHAKAGGLGHREVEAAFGTGVDWPRVWTWAAGTMCGDGWRDGGLITPPGVPADLERGLWLVSEPEHGREPNVLHRAVRGAGRGAVA